MAVMSPVWISGFGVVDSGTPGNPAAGLHAIQLEINRALYMDERRYERSSHFARLAADLETLASRLGEIQLEELRPYRAAAE
jgi:N-formylglutamate amidohydrolase